MLNSLTRDLKYFLGTKYAINIWPTSIYIFQTKSSFFGTLNQVFFLKDVSSLIKIPCTLVLICASGDYDRLVLTFVTHAITLYLITSSWWGGGGGEGRLGHGADQSTLMSDSHEHTHAWSRSGRWIIHAHVRWFTATAAAVTDAASDWLDPTTIT